jgi:hypothetical protein
MTIEVVATANVQHCKIDCLIDLNQCHKHATRPKRHRRSSLTKEGELYVANLQESRTYLRGGGGCAALHNAHIGRAFGNIRH